MTSIGIWGTVGRVICNGYRPIRQPVINILLCYTFPGLLPDNIPSYEFMVVKLFHSINQDITFNTYQMWDGRLSEHHNLITGANNAAYDTLSWIRKAANMQIPLVVHLFRPTHPHLPRTSRVYHGVYVRYLILNHAENEDDAVKQAALKTLGEMKPQGETVARFLLRVR